MRGRFGCILGVVMSSLGCVDDMTNKAPVDRRGVHLRLARLGFIDIRKFNLGG